MHTLSLYNVIQRRKLDDSSNSKTNACLVVAKSSQLIKGNRAGPFINYNLLSEDDANRVTHKKYEIS